MYPLLPINRKSKTILAHRAKPGQSCPGFTFFYFYKSFLFVTNLLLSYLTGSFRHDLAAIDIPVLSFRILGIRIVDTYTLDFLAVVVLAGDTLYIDAAQFRLEFFGNLGIQEIFLAYIRNAADTGPVFIAKGSFQNFSFLSPQPEKLNPLR